MNPQFVENESYKHKMAKIVLKNWFDSTKWGGYAGIGDINFTPNRESGVFLEYPICKNIPYTYTIDRYDEAYTIIKKETKNSYHNSWNTNWDEIKCDCDEKSNFYDEYVPTYDECINTHKSFPVAIIDIVCAHKGSPKIGIEICHKNPVSQEKIDKLIDFGVDNLIEIDADWILNQTKIPDKLKYKRLI